MIYTTKEEAQREADIYNMGSDYSTALVVKTDGGWSIKIK